MPHVCLVSAWLTALLPPPLLPPPLLCVLQLCYISLYQGRDRGVLLQLGQGELLGHFPLGLFDEAMAKPAPSL